MCSAVNLAHTARSFEAKRNNKKEKRHCRVLLLLSLFLNNAITISGLALGTEGRLFSSNIAAKFTDYGSSAFERHVFELRCFE